MKRSEGLAALLAMVAGYVDAYGYLTYGTFLSFMSGNTTTTGYSLGQRHPSVAVPSMVAIAAFVSGATIGAALTHERSHRSRQVVIALVAVLLCVAIVVAYVYPFIHLFQIATVGVAMGMMNSSVTRVGAESVSLTFVTGTLNKIGSHLAQALARSNLPDAEGPGDTHAGRAARLAGIWSAFLFGAILAGAATPRFASLTLVPPVAVLIVLLFLEHRGNRTR